MSTPVYLGIRARRTLVRAAGLLEEEAKTLKHSHAVDGVLLDIRILRDHGELVDTAKELRRIARERVNKETKR